MTDDDVEYVLSQAKGTNRLNRMLASLDLQAAVQHGLLAKEKVLPVFEQLCVTGIGAEAVAYAYTIARLLELKGMSISEPPPALVNDRLNPKVGSISQNEWKLAKAALADSSFVGRKAALNVFLPKHGLGSEDRRMLTGLIVAAELRAKTPAEAEFWKSVARITAARNPSMSG